MENFMGVSFWYLEKYHGDDVACLDGDQSQILCEYARSISRLNDHGGLHK